MNDAYDVGLLILRLVLGLTLAAHGYSRARAADALGINRTTLYKKMKRLGLEEGRYAVS